jgi:hypothetical protein
MSAFHVLESSPESLRLKLDTHGLDGEADDLVRFVKLHVPLRTAVSGAMPHEAVRPSRPQRSSGPRRAARIASLSRARSSGPAVTGRRTRITNPGPTQ